MTKDLTVGNPSKTLWVYSVPLILSSIFQQLYTMADSIIAGKYAGRNALAAVGASFPITMMFIALATGVNIGCSVVISQLFGSKKNNDVKLAINTSLISVFVLSIFMTIFGLLFCIPILSQLNTPAEIFDDSALYLNIYVLGIIFLFMYNTCTGVFAALGDSKTPLYLLILSSVVNVILDLIFVINFHWGVAGVAWATFIAQGGAAIIAFALLMKRTKEIETTIKVKKFSFNMLKRISVMAVPSACQKSFVSIGNLMIQSLINGFGEVTIAGVAAAMKLSTFMVNNIITLGTGISAYTAQNYGAGKMDRVQQGVKAGLTLMIGFVLFSTFACFVFSPQLVGLFIDSGGDDVVAVGVEFLRVLSPFYIFTGIKIVCDAVLRGTSTMVQFMVTTFADLILRVGFSFLLVERFGQKGIWFSWPIGWIMGAMLSLAFYKSGVWKHESKKEEKKV